MIETLTFLETRFPAIVPTVKACSLCSLIFFILPRH